MLSLSSQSITGTFRLAPKVAKLLRLILFYTEKLINIIPVKCYLIFLLSLILILEIFIKMDAKVSKKKLKQC